MKRAGLHSLARSVFLVVALMAPASRALAAPDPAVVAVGDTLPPLRGRNLAGHGVTFPDATRGSVTLLALGFTYGSRHAVDAWVDSFRVDVAGRPRTHAFRVPMLGGLGRVARGFIDGGMRRGTPRREHPFVVTVTDDVGTWKKRLGDPGGDVAHVLLLDRRGRVAFRFTGEFAPAGRESLAALARRL